MPSSALAAAGAQLASAALARRDATTTTRRRIEAAPARKRIERLGPTPERLAKGDVLRVGGVHRSVPPVKRLYDQGKLDPDPTIARALLRAAEQLYVHYVNCGSDLKAQNIGRAAIGVDVGALMGGECRAWHDARFRDATRVMGWHEAAPHQGNGRIVVGVVCAEMTLGQAEQYLPSAREALMAAIVLDRLRQGLFALAAHWGLL